MSCVILSPQHPLSAGLTSDSRLVRAYRGERSHNFARKAYIPAPRNAKVETLCAPEHSDAPVTR